jgi:ATP-dependent protease ClpP protease subunit
MSAGITIMAAFPRENRYLTQDAVLLVHERRLQKTIELNGPVRANMQIAQQLVAELESAERLEREGFADFEQGSKISVEELYERATKNCYLTAQEALDLALIAALL